MLASLIFETVLSFPIERRTKPISVLCTDTRVEIPAIVEMVEGTLEKMRRCSEKNEHAYRCQSPSPSPPTSHFGSTLLGVGILRRIVSFAGVHSA